MLEGNLDLVRASHDLWVCQAVLVDFDSRKVLLNAPPGRRRRQLSVTVKSWAYEAP